MKKNWTESSAWEIVKSAGDLLALNVLCFLCCIPVLTIVASFSAMYSVLFKLKRDRTIPVIRTFLSSLKENLLPSLAVELVVIVLSLIAYGDAYYAMTQTGTQQFLFLTVATVMVVVALILMTYGTSQIAYFRNTVKGYLKNSFVLALIAPGWMVLVWLLWAVILGVLLVFPQIVLQYFGWAYFLWGLSFPAFISAMIFTKVFKRFEPKPEVGPEEEAAESEEAESEAAESEGAADAESDDDADAYSDDDADAYSDDDADAESEDDADADTDDTIDDD